MWYQSEPDRRTVLKTLGASVVAGTALSGTASAEKNHYGRGNGLEVFLNEEALFKDDLWDGEIANKMGQEVVDVAVGAMTSVDFPDWFPTPPGQPLPEALPVAFAPKVVKVSPGATVRWTWVSNPAGHPIPHDVTSLVDDDGKVVLERHADQRFHNHHEYTPVPDGPDVNPTFEFTFEERGNHLYYCTPHGSPFSLGTGTNPETGEEIEIINEFGMRGAVKVAGRALEGSEPGSKGR